MHPPGVVICHSTCELVKLCAIAVNHHKIFECDQAALPCPCRREAAGTSGRTPEHIVQRMKVYLKLLESFQKVAAESAPGSEWQCVLYSWEVRTAGS